MSLADAQRAVAEAEREPEEGRIPWRFRDIEGNRTKRRAIPKACQ
jgi:hypothetical protein